MSEIIAAKDVELVKNNSRILDIISPYVTLKNAGSGSFKGLCPFHTEKTGSFTVRTSINRYHCFGCSATGDSISFLMNFNSLTFPEAIEYLADKQGITLHYENSRQTEKPKGPSRMRLFAANLEAKKFFQAKLREGTAGSRIALEILHSRKFSDEQIDKFSIGYAPDSWSELLNHLAKLGFSREELLLVGLIKQSSNNKTYDVFRNRIMWPIVSVTGEVLGFGGRQIVEDKNSGKYINTKESPIYKKSQVLYGIDLAKRAIAKERKVVIVEGYTDVMAMNISGIEYAIAPCGTAFTDEHIQIVRRIMGDSDPNDSLIAGKSKIIFVFDPDTAGQNATLKAFAKEGEFITQTYVATSKTMLDPADLRAKYGNQAIVDLIDSAIPMYEHIINTALSNYDLQTPEGKVFALKAAAPVIAGIKDPVLRPIYARKLATDLQIPENDVNSEIQKGTNASPSQNFPPNQPEKLNPQTNISTPNNAFAKAEVRAMAFLLQNCENIRSQDLKFINPEYFLNPELKLVLHKFTELANQSNLQTAAQKICEVLEPSLAQKVQQLHFCRYDDIIPEQISEFLAQIGAEIANDFTKAKSYELTEKIRTTDPKDAEYNNLVKEYSDLQKQIK